MASRSCSTWVVALMVLTGSATAVAGEVVTPNLVPTADESDAARDFDVGSRLRATADVKLRDVSLSKGARVVVRGVEAKRGRASSFDVELADGQVLRRIDAGTIRRSFVIADD